ncbi:hypothetical protein [Microbacterium sp. 10M-3C3]|uniref:hypothetical protein n=1 Tax=Microbacterium sp. 10M-3C3 TaxID=2483401 RepID=UPI000F633E1B|nr:hypothetical protein [Microbacterium sp. 10M-3C3]
MAALTGAETGSGGFGTQGARWGFVILWAGGVVSAILAGGFGATPEARWHYAAALALDLCAVVLVTERASRGLAPARAAATALVATLAAAIGFIAYANGSEIWVVANATTMAAILFARGNPRWATVAVLACVAPTTIGAATGLVSSPDAIYVLGVAGLMVPSAILWRPALASILRREQRHRTVEARAALEAEASAIAMAEYGREMQRIRDDAAPLLERLASADALDDADLTELAVTEGAIRDRMRSPLARDEELIAAIARARRRGIRVLLLWDGDPAGTPDPALVHRLGEIVDAAASGSLVVRGGQGRDEMWVVRTDGDAVSRIVLDDRGRTREVL